jgi:predicted SAM-dependent methyltransferase
MPGSVPCQSQAASVPSPVRYLYDRLPPAARRSARQWYRSCRSLQAAASLRARITWGKVVRFAARPPLPRHPGGERYVHLGCGPINHPAFINVDAIPLPHVHYVGGISRLPMFRDETVDLLYASHCLEHLSYRDTQEILAEWCRVLKPGGVLRISVPDLDRLIEIYEADDRNLGSIIGQLYGGHDNPYNVHMAIFTRTSLEHLMVDVGFENCRLWSPGGDHLSTIGDFSSYLKKIGSKDYPVSLNLEATKRHAI